jgi:nitrogen regulatory protein P-II 1
VKLIVAVIHPELLGPVQTALDRLGVCDVSISQVLVNCKEEGYTLIYRSATIPVHILPRLRLEIVVEDYAAQTTVAAIENTRFPGATGPVGTRKIYMRSLEDDVRGRFGAYRAAVAGDGQSGKGT